ncbi:hypothetical protein HZU77_006955 [Neisseriaceae bacterium TC5R-5]|nr:hypothetical protein [Neisseriaceae bacterium TC5R-5]
MMSPLFLSSHDALVFAMNRTHHAYDRPLINRLASPSNSSGKGLAGTDGIAQAAMIRLALSELNPLYQAMLTASTAQPILHCGCGAICCCGAKPNDEWVQAISYLAEHVRETALAGCHISNPLLREYVARYFLPKAQRSSLEDLALTYSLSRNSVGTHTAKVARYFSGTPGSQSQVGLKTLAWEAIDHQLQARGIIRFVHVA